MNRFSTKPLFSPLFSSFFLGFFIIISSLEAQKKISPEWITIDEGLSQGFISALHQDENGFLWVGTKSGLDRYDGRSFQNITNSILDITELQNQQVRSLAGNKRLMLVATEGDLYVYLPEYKQFYAFKLGQGIGQILSSNETTFWLAGLDGTLYKLIIKDEIPSMPGDDFELDSYFSIVKNESTLINSYYKLSFIGDQFVYFEKDGSDKKLMLFDLKTEKPIPLPSFKYSQVPRAKKIGYVVFDESILVYTDDDLFVFHQGTWKKYGHLLDVINAKHLEKQQKVVISTLDSYLFFDYASIQNGEMNPSDAVLIYPSKKTQFYNTLKDYSGNVWIGSAGYGLMKINEKQTKIEHFFEGKSIYVKPFISEQGTVFLNNPTTEEKLMIPNNSEESRYIKQFADTYEEVNFIQNPVDKTVWGISINGYYLDIYKLTSNGFRFFTHIDTNFGFHIRLFEIEPTSNQMIIAIGERFIFLDLKSGQQTSYEHGQELNLLSFFVESENRFWLGAEQGLLRVEKKEGRFSHELLTSENTNLVSTRIASIYQDQEDPNRLWIGTKGASLHRYNIEKDFFEYIDLAGKFPDNTIYGILEDDHQNLWLSSNKGLICFNKITEEVKHFIKNDGLQGNEFNTYAYEKGNNGLMYFGGTNGLNIFNPDDLTQNDYLSKAFITEIQLNNQLLESNLAYEHIKELQLNYQENNLSFTFASTELTAPQKNQFRYYLEGAEDEWAHTSIDNTANYLNLRPGNYTLKLKSSNSDGLWNPEYRSINILITPPWYESNLAYFFYVLLLITLVMGIVKIRENRINSLREREKIALENELLESKIAYKEKDLIDLANTISENEKWRDYLLKSLKKVQGARGNSRTKLYNDLINQIKIKTSIENSRIEYQKKIDTLNNEFNNNLLKQYPQLSKNDLRLCSLIKLDFTTKEIALVQNIEVRSVYINRSRLRKK